MDTILMNSKNSRTSNPHRFLLNFNDKIKMCYIIKFFIYYTWKNMKKLYKNIKLKNQLQYQMANSND